jgi:hypothetical protein
LKIENSKKNKFFNLFKEPDHFWTANKNNLDKDTIVLKIAITKPGDGISKLLKNYI